MDSNFQIIIWGQKRKRGKVVIRFLLAGNENDCKNYNNANVSKKLSKNRDLKFFRTILSVKELYRANSSFKNLKRFK